MAAKKSFKAAITDTGAGVDTAAAASTKLSPKKIQSEFDRFHEAVKKENNDQGCQEIIQGWKKAGYLPTMLNAKSMFNWTVLMIVIAYGRIDVAQALLAAGKEYSIQKDMLEAKQNDGRNALMVATGYGRIDAVKAFLAAGKEHGILKEMLRHKNRFRQTIFDAAKDNSEITNLLENAALEEAFGDDVLEAIFKQPEIRDGLVSRAKRFVMVEIGKKNLETARTEIAAELRKDAEEQIKKAKKQIENAQETIRLADSFEKAGAGSKGDHQDPVSKRDCHGTPHAIVESPPSCGQK